MKSFLIFILAITSLYSFSQTEKDKDYRKYLVQQLEQSKEELEIERTALEELYSELSDLNNVYYDKKTDKHIYIIGIGPVIIAASAISVAFETWTDKIKKTNPARAKKLRKAGLATDAVGLTLFLAYTLSYPILNRLNPEDYSIKFTEDEIDSLEQKIKEQIVLVESKIAAVESKVNLINKYEDRAIN